MKILIVGSGYVGLVTGGCLAELGHQVTCMDNDSRKISLLKEGKIPIYEPGLEGLILANAADGRLAFTDALGGHVEDNDVIFICVPTPPTENGEADLTYVEGVARDLAREMKSYKLIVEKSTVPVQTALWLESVLRAHFPKDVPFDIACNPEFLREGSAIHDFMNPDRVVIGTSSDRAAQILVKLYEPLNAPLLITDIESAELIKHASNAFLAMKISFINAISQICERTNADVMKVAKGIGLDSRIGLNHLVAGVGYGGACLPKDLQAFLQRSRKLGYHFELLEAVEKINQEQRLYLFRKLCDALGVKHPGKPGVKGEVVDFSLKGKVVAVLGLSFKPNTDDLRGAPSLDLISWIRERGGKIRAYDPVAMPKARELFQCRESSLSARGAPRAGEPARTRGSIRIEGSPQDLVFTGDPYDAATGAHALLILTEWEVFRRLHLPRIREVMAAPVVIDGRNLFDPGKMRSLGFIYRGIGR